MPRRRPPLLTNIDLLLPLGVCAALGSSFAAAGGAPWWAWVIALSPLAPAAVVTYRCVLQTRRNSRPAAPQCLRCGYNLTGNVSGMCPECGEIV